MARAKRILIVEDDYVIGLDMQTILADAGVETLGPVGRCCTAVELIDSESPDAAVVDGNLNGESAESVAARLRASAIPFIFVSGYGRDHLPPEFADVPLIRKPFEPDALVDAIRTMLPQED